MSERHGSVWWSELMTRDVLAAMAYYRKVCGWDFDEMEMQSGATYYLAMRGGRPVAGVMDMSPLIHMNEVPAHWFTYFAVDDVEAAVRDTVDQGGELTRDPFDIPNIGRIAIVKDSTGAPMGLMTPEIAAA